MAGAALTGRVMSFLADSDVKRAIDRLEIPFNQHGLDHYGIGKKDLLRFFSVLKWFYRNYFKVRVHGIEHVPKRGRAMLVGNHSGGVALDGAMVLAAMMLEMDPPRLAQGMAEKFINQLPIASLVSSRCGQFTGLPEHAERLLRDERLLLVFPEGARGTAKLYWERHSLVDFGTGFMRLSLGTNTPIVPFAFLGGGEAIPTVANLYRLGKLLGAPYIPVTPWIVAVPRPVQLDIFFGAPMRFGDKADEEDAVVEANVEKVKLAIAELIEQGKKERSQ